MTERSGFKIGRIFGINIRIDWSWLFILLLLVWNLTTVFGEWHADWDLPLTIATATGAALLFFVSVVAHELAHSLVAKSRGVPVKSITLFLFGGVSNIQKDPDSPGAEFAMAILGPVTSFVLGGMLLWITMASIGSSATILQNPQGLMGQMGPLVTLMAWLGSVNVTLGAFNLIPGFPLDGGRVLRSILWAITDDLRRATRWASWVGQGIAWLMIVGGVAMIFGARIPVLGQGFANGLWMAFIGWFLNMASSRSYQRVVIHDILEGVPVTRLMLDDPPVVSSTLSVGDFVHEHIMRTDEQSFPVMEDGELLGIVSLEDVRSVPRDRWDVTSIDDVMTHADDLVTVSVDEDAAHALDRLSRRDVRQIPITDSGRMVGVLRRRDIVKWLRLHAEAFS